MSVGEQTKTGSVARVVLGAILEAVGITAAVVPQYTNCGGKMHCYTTAHWELALGIILAVAGFVIILVGHRVVGIVLSALSAVVSLLVILFPVSITGVCDSDKMWCVSKLKPTEILLGVIGIVVSLALLFVYAYFGRRQDSVGTDRG